MKLIYNIVLDFSEALESWSNHYEFHDGQEELVSSLFYRKMKSGFYNTITLDKCEIEVLYGEVDECVESLGELNILL